MRLIFMQNKRRLGLFRAIRGVLTAALFFCVAVVVPASAADWQPSTNPVSEVPPGAHLEDDIIRWDIEPEAAPSGNYWPGGVIPFVFSSNVTAANQTLMTNAMQAWENIADVNFRLWQTGDTNWLFIQDSTRNSSFVGPQSGAQVVNITSWNSHFIIVHELGHALGVEHEQARHDRDTYVTINYKNIASTCGTSGTESCDYNFDIEAATKPWLYSPYDYDSVMHYGATAFTTGGNTIDTEAPYNAHDISYVNQDIGPNGQCFTDDVPVGTWQAGIGQRNHMSHWDCRMISFVYPEDNWRFVSDSRAGDTETGLFTAPWNTFSEGVSGTPSGGTIWIDDGGVYSGVTINKSLTLLAPKGTVRIE